MRSTSWSRMTGPGYRSPNGSGSSSVSLASTRRAAATTVGRGSALPSSRRSPSGTVARCASRPRRLVPVLRFASRRCRYPAAEPLPRAAVPLVRRQPLPRGSELIEDVVNRLDAETGAVGDGEVPILEDERVGDVPRVITAGRRRIAWEREPGQGGKRDVACAAKPGLQHPAAPDRDPAGAAQVVDAPRLEIAADPTRFDVDDASSPQRERVGGGLRGCDRLVQADRRTDQGGELGVLAEVLLTEWLLDQQQVEPVECSKGPCVGKDIRGVRIDLQKKIVAEPLSDRAHRPDVPARLDLELDSEVALIKVCADRVEQLRHGIHDPYRDTGWNAGAASAEVEPERLAACTQPGVEHRPLHCGLRHSVPLDRGKQ